MIPAAGPGHWNDPDMVRHFMQLFLRKDNFYYWIIDIIFLQLMISYIFLAYCRWLWFKLWRIQSSICYLGSHGVCKYMIIMILLGFYDSAAPYSSDASFFCTLVVNKGEPETLVSGDKVQGTTGRKKRRSARFLLFCLPSNAKLHRERHIWVRSTYSSLLMNMCNQPFINLFGVY